MGLGGFSFDTIGTDIPTLIVAFSHSGCKIYTGYWYFDLAKVGG